jgi:hypothetical protein
LRCGGALDFKSSIGVKEPTKRGRGLRGTALEARLNAQIFQVTVRGRCSLVECCRSMRRSIVQQGSCGRRSRVVVPSRLVLWWSSREPKKRPAALRLYKAPGEASTALSFSGASYQLQPIKGGERPPNAGSPPHNRHIAAASALA